MMPLEASKAIRALAGALREVTAVIQDTYPTPLDEDDTPALFKVRSGIVAKMGELLKDVV